MNGSDVAYPVTLEIDYPRRELNRVTTFFRLFTIIAATALMLLFRRKYPRWWYDWNLAVTRFGMRISAYGALLRDEYPSTDDEQAVHLEIPYPDVSLLSPWLPLVKWLLAIPHYLVLAVLCVAGLRRRRGLAGSSSRVATREGSSISSSASCAGGFAWRRMRSC